MNEYTHGKEEERQRYISADTDISYAGDGLYCAYSRNDRAGSIISAEQAQLVDFFDSPRLPSDVIEMLGNRGWIVEESGRLHEQIHELAEKGLLRAEAALHDGIRNSEENDSVDDIRLCWVTADRPASASGSVRSFIENLQKYGRENEIRVFDDSAATDAGTGKAKAGGQDHDCGDHLDYEQRLAELSRATGFPIRYAGMREKLEYIDELKKRCGSRGIDPALLDFAVTTHEGGRGWGANRNSALLATAGERMVFHDDDVFCRPADSAAGSTADSADVTAAKETVQELQLSSGKNTYQSADYTDRENLEAELRLVNLDYVGLHHPLGQHIEDYLGAETGSFDTDELGREFAAALERQEGSVTISSLGFYGDTALTSNRSFLHATGQSRRKLLYADEASYERYLASRWVARSVERRSLRDSSSFFTLATGIDNSTPLPPFFPLYRNEDSIFSTTLGICRPGAYRLYHPWMIEHRPPQPRSFGRSETTEPYPLVSTFILFAHAEYMGRYRPHTADSAAGSGAPEYYPGLGRYLQHIGRLSRASFTEYAYHVWRSYLSRQSRFYGELLEHFDYRPEYWAEDVQSMVERARQLLTDGRLPVPAEMTGMDPPEHALAHLQKMIGDFGALIEVWPEIWHAAKELREQGKRMSRKL